MAGRVLVTGGAGFIGRYLVQRLLDEGRPVVVLDNLDPTVHGPDADFPAEVADATLVRGDVRDADVWREALEGVTRVYHLAAATGTGESMYRARRYVAVNAGGTALFTDLVTAGEAPGLETVVLASSRAVYGEGPYACNACGVVTPEPRSPEALAAGRWEPVCPSCGGAVEPVPQGPDAPIRPSSVYGLTKWDQERLLEAVLPARGVSLSALRFQNVYGPGQSLRNPYVGVLQVFATRLLAGEDVSVFEDGMESRDFVYVDDAVQALWAAGEGSSGGEAMATVDVGSGVRTTLVDAARTLADVLEVPAERVHVTGEYRVGDVRHAVASSRAVSELVPGWSPRSFRDGVEELLSWIRTQPPGGADVGRALGEMKDAGLYGRSEA